MARPRLGVGTLQLHGKKAAPFPKSRDTLAVRHPLVLMASLAVRRHKYGLKSGQRSRGIPGAHFPNQERAGATLVLSAEGSCVPGAGDRQAGPGPGTTYSLQPPCIHPSPLGLAWFKLECLAGSASSLPPLFATPLAQRPPLLVSPHAVEGQWLEWGPWGPCSTSCANGTQQRSRKCSVAGPAWATCTGALTDTRECSNLECPGECSLPGPGAGGNPASGGATGATHAPPPPAAADGKWGPWNAWSLCSKTCDTGWQRRFRMCQASGAQGYPCEGTGEEVKPCSEKRCPGIGRRPPGRLRGKPVGLAEPLHCPHSLPRDVQGRVCDADDMEEGSCWRDHLQQVPPQRLR